MVYPLKPFFLISFLDTLGEGDVLYVVRQTSCDDLAQVIDEIEPLGITVNNSEAAMLLLFNDEELTLPSTLDPNKAVTIRAVGLSDADYESRSI